MYDYLIFVVAELFFLCKINWKCSMYIYNIIIYMYNKFNLLDKISPVSLANLPDEFHTS